MIGKIYNLKLYHGLNDFIHNGGATVIEVYVPDLGIAYNRLGHIFLVTNLNRYEKKSAEKEIEISDTHAILLKTMAEILKTKQNVELQLKEYLTQITEN